VYEDRYVLAFMDLNPTSVGHMLVISKDHWENIYEIPEKILFEIVKTVKHVCIAVKKTVNADGVKIIQLNGRSAGQAVMHIHFHVIPIVSTFGKMIKTHGPVRSDRVELDKIAEKIQKNL
jgi:diadenosine tetraphosphate (Ap4A) HIT family hydrolase